MALIRCSSIVHQAHRGQGQIKIFDSYFFNSGVQRVLNLVPVKVDAYFLLNERVRLYNH